MFSGSPCCVIFTLKSHCVRQKGEARHMIVLEIACSAISLLFYVVFHGARSPFRDSTVCRTGS